MSGRGSGLSPSRFQGNFVVSERPNFLGRIFADAGCDYGREGNPVRRSLLVTVSTCVIAWAICFSNVEALALQWFFERYTFSFNGESVYAVLLSLPTRLKIRVSLTRFSKIESL